MDIEQMKKDLGGGNVFPIGEENVVFAKYFTGECYLNMLTTERAVEHLEEVHDDIVSKAFDGTYLIRKLKQRNICLRILYGMKKCGQVTYAKQLSAALEQEGVELTL